MRRLVNWILGRRCESCRYWMNVRFAMGNCRRGPFVSLALEDGRKRACEHWRSREARKEASHA